MNSSRLKVVPTLLILLLAFSVPVYGQATPQTPTGFVQDMTQMVSTLGPLVVVLVALVILSLGVVVLLIIAAARGLAPLLGTVKFLTDALSDERRARETTQQRADQDRLDYASQAAAGGVVRQQQADTLKQIAEINERSLTLVSGLETRHEAAEARTIQSKVITDHSDDNVKAVNTFTETAMKPIDEKLGQLIKDIETIRDTALTKAQLDDAVSPLTTKLDDVIQTLHEIQLERTEDELTPDAPAPDKPDEKKE